MRLHHDKLLNTLDNFDRKPDTLAVTETWLEETETFNDYRIGEKINP